MADVTLTIGAENSQFIKALDQSKSSTKKFGSALVDDIAPKFGVMASAGTTAFGVISAGAAPAVGAVGAIGLAAFNVANDFSKAQSDIQASLGLSARDAEIFAEVANEVFKDGVGGSLDEVSDAVIAAKQSFGEMVSASDIGPITSQAMALAEVMGEDVNKVLNTGAALARNFGISHQEAMDLMAAGQVNGANAAGDMLDTLGEYTDTLGDMGFTGEQTLSLMVSGMSGAAEGTDKAIDAINEMMDRLATGGEDVEEAFRQMGLGAFKPFEEAVRSGEKTWADFAPQIIDGLKSIDDPLAKLAAETAIFGDIPNDLGQNFIDGFTTINGAFDDTSGQAKKMLETTQTVGDRFNAVWRSGLDELRPLGEGIMDIAEASLPILSEGMDRIKDTIMAAAPLVSNAMSQISAAFGGSGEAVSGMDIAIGILSAGIDIVVSGVQAFTVVMWALGEAINGIAAFFEPLDEKLTSFIDKINSFEMPDFSFPGFGGDGEGGSPLDFLPGFADGGFVPGSPGQAVPIMAHGGEFVLSRDMISGLESGKGPAQAPAAQGSGMTNIDATTTDVILDGQRVGRFVTQYQGRKIKQASMIGGPSEL